MEPDQLRKADAIEIVVGQGAKPGGGGMLLGQKISKRVADMRTLPEGIDQRSPCRHPDWTGPDDLEIKINELREITDWEKPIYVKVGAARPYYDTALAVKAGADVVVLDGMQGGTAATQDVFIEHVGIPTLAAIRPAVQALIDLDMHRKVQLIVSGGIRNGADVAKALALGADAVSIGTAALIALGDNHPGLEDEYRKLGTTAGSYDDWHEGRDPAGITTQDPELAKRLDPVAAGRRLANYLSVLTLEAQTIARACGKSHLHNLEPEDLVALTMESAAMAQVPLAGTSWIPGQTMSSNDEGSAMASFGAYAKKNGIKYFLISFVDLFGTMRAKIVPATAIDTMAKAGAGFAGFAVWFDMTPAARRHPGDGRSRHRDPASLEAGGRVGHRRPDDGRQAGGAEPAPGAQARRSPTRRDDGYDMKTGVECEYFMILPDGSAISDGADTQSKPCYDQQALMRRYETITEICDCMITLGWGPYQNDHEDANGQFEMNWEYDSALKTADKHAFFKFMVKSIAEKHGLRATFMPKPFANLTGNGCHAHVSLWQKGRRTCSTTRRASSACRRSATTSSAASCIRPRA